MRIGDYSVIFDGRECPLAVIRTGALRPAAFFRHHGRNSGQRRRGDFSLAYWRENHRAFFERSGYWSEGMALVVKEFMPMEILWLCLDVTCRPG
ncbi:ASCH domain-containing protein [Sodalis-like endosymbiont of Proechinophthirus fluctus]|uniref:ASCH domain-containing protein n=1 Tax=Sodalis-like endosymbiont of Proechinophthirus fluctus TaxID=1462730 RepID=UPI00082BEA9A|nr:ASCH domain-containing protein [Sodalis-like endosymbiont of Proechinophthirus fluctus]